MKTITLLSLALVSIGFASCRKEFSCECTVTDNGVISTTAQKAKLTKRQAQKWCDAYNVNIPDYKYECSLK